MTKDKYYWLPRQLSMHIITLADLSYYGFEEAHSKAIKVAFSYNDFFITKCLKCSYYEHERCQGVTLDIQHCMAGHKKPDMIQMSIQVPLTIWNFGINTFYHLHNRVRLYNAKYHKGEYYYKSYRLGNVGPTGSICWGQGGFVPKDLREAYNLFWTKPFNDDLAPNQAELSIDSLKKYNPESGDPDTAPGIDEDLPAYPFKIDKDQPQFLFKGTADILFCGIDAATINQFPESEWIKYQDKPAVLGLIQVGQDEANLVFTKNLVWCKTGKALGRAKHRLIGSHSDFNKISVYYKE